MAKARARKAKGRSKPRRVKAPMVKRKKSKSRKGGYKAAPTTVKSVFKQQPLLVKGGILVTGLQMISTPAGPYATSIADKLMEGTKASATVAVKQAPYALLKPTNYYPIIFGVIGHKAAKMLGVKGL